MVANTTETLLLGDLETFKLSEVQVGWVGIGVGGRGCSKLEVNTETLLLGDLETFKLSEVQVGWGWG